MDYKKYNEEISAKHARGIGNSFTMSLGYKCVNCGKELPPSTVQFWKTKRKLAGWERQILCYQCYQELKKKQND